MGLIIAKSNGLDLSTHTHSVMNTAYVINELGKYGLDNRMFRYASIYHDLGKANPLFQSNMLTNNFEKVCRHEISSILFCSGIPKDIRDGVVYIILSHHKSLIDDARSLLKMYEERPKELYKNHIGDISVWGEDVKRFLSDYYNIEIEVPTYEECVKIIDYYAENISNLECAWSPYRGVFMMADHFASCYDNDVERLSILKDLFKPVNTDFYNGKNEKYPLSLIESDKTKKHTFVIAPTGCGKTNFVLKRCTERIFYTLPFQASINAMYKRIKNDIGNDYLMGIKHSSMSSVSFLDDRSKELSNLFGLSIKVATPFQLMSPLLGTKGYESVIMDIKGQDVILDEIHTYNSVALYAVIELIKFLKSIDCNIHICTATIPTIFANKILEILGEEDTQIVRLSDDTLKTFDRHIIHTIDSLNYKDIVKRYKSGDKVLVVRNKVTSAKDTYVALKALLPNSKILLLHSRFERKRKSEIEEQLYKFNSENEPCIVVSTQVVEVSLDINFDCMFTDCADIMSLIQRFGRINRQRKNIGVYKDIYIAKWHNEGEYVIYPNDICDKTYNVLSKYNGKVLEETKIQSIIDEVHDEFNIQEAKRFSPTIDGVWKQKIYCNNVNDSIGKALEITGSVGVLMSKVQYYLKTMDKGVEIPIMGTKIGNVQLQPYKENEDGYTMFYIVPDYAYSNEFGLVR